ncbi:hypothetical protein [Parerythrobacter jejuensis]|uniref:17 kDa surface antigen n=1 Tax=Parerythrobacter jejuensis TaxID=795812 RepID=A0A845ATF4_9SPHN|nr:hypothetical protein [Parerythrobacter jejuensis]MXP30830.1 hypothetical protein [Parerythrobacter jejuensis]MXP33590.1 hypothetical protein [Parerythrobacter jejuensis]
MRARSKFCTLVFATSVAYSGPALANDASSLGDLVGARAGQAERSVEARGFTYITGNAGRHSTRHSYWWNSASKNCVHIVTQDGRYSRITDASRRDCNQKSGGGDVAAAVGVVAGAAILGALLGGHKKHHHDDDRHYDDRDNERQYQRGYNDGLHSLAYHNYDRSDAYSSGYSAGVDQRRYNSDYHHGNGGYGKKARFRDLIGGNGRSARGELGRRGFTRVDRFGDDNTRYSIMWRAQSMQCLQVTIANDRVYDIRDIGRHPKCR